MKNNVPETQSKRDCNTNFATCSHLQFPDNWQGKSDDANIKYHIDGGGSQLGHAFIAAGTIEGQVPVEGNRLA